MQVEELKRRKDVEVININQGNRDEVTQMVFEKVREQLEAAGSRS